tara:strand:+ start:249 stop:407 length:159 start_codon:yes stop_codon:yes gene_type:complete
MDDQKNIRDIQLRLKNEEEREAEEKLERELKERKDHLKRLEALHRNSKGCKW